ncbi:MAG: serine--tRNA ligase [Alphaproteobacteria bacterium]
MHDIKFIREHPEAFTRALERRNLDVNVDDILEHDKQLRLRKTESQNAQSKRNQINKEIGMARGKGDEARVKELMNDPILSGLDAYEEVIKKGEEELDNILSRIPNLLADDVPEGKDESANHEIRRWGDAPTMTNPKDHVALGEALGLMDFAAAAKISGARFVVLKGALARLERALAAFMLDLHTSEFGYLETNPPYLVKAPALYGTGQLPKFAEDLFQTKNDYWLIPTAEVSLTYLVAREILDETKLPLRFTAHTPCFRSEAGAAGKDTRGMIRQHQFSKVELVSITTPEQSDAEHERMTACAEEVLKRLGLPYRVMLLCAGDTGFSARKTYDIEVWLPGQGKFREISSCSNCGDFQARRMSDPKERRKEGVRFKRTGAKETESVHTLNGSGLAVGRTLVAVMENYQQADGSIKIPPALGPYMGGLTEIR